MILVTGANGFVGRALCAELVRVRQPVRAAVRAANREQQLATENVTIGELGPGTDWTAALQGVTRVVHLAARVHVMRETEADSLAAFRAVNVAATASLARAAARAGIERLVYVSSVKVNGERTFTASFTPDDIPAPQDPYAVSKWEAEQSLRRTAAETGLELAIVRPPLVYGPGVGGNFLRLLNLVRHGVPLPIAGIENRRSMVYSGNLASALVACTLHPSAAGNTYLVSDGEDLSTSELVRRLAEHMGTRARLFAVPRRMLDLAAAVTGRKSEIERLTGSLCVDSSALRIALQWRPPFSVAAGLQETTRWFCEAQAASSACL